VLLIAGSGKHQRVIAVPVFSVPDFPLYDSACVLDPTDHSFIEHPSYIDYRHARDDDADHLISCVQSGIFVIREKSSDGLVERIITELASSKFISRHFKKMFS
jgi:catabolite regulation protein CreA